jgi:hypothetical protein
MLTKSKNNIICFSNRIIHAAKLQPITTPRTEVNCSVLHAEKRRMVTAAKKAVENSGTYCGR